MTRVCLVGREDVNLQYELLSRETAREALATYDLREPFENSVGLETVSLGAAVSLLNDLNWYLVRYVDEAMVLEPSVSDAEWLSRDLARAIRDDEVSPEESERFLKVYGLGSDPSPVDEASDRDDETSPPGETDGDATDLKSVGDPTDGESDEREAAGTDESPSRLVEPMYVTRTGEDIPDYDLRDVDETLVERVTESEFGA